MIKTTINITPVILSGGSGTRLWPLSKPSYPKQFLNLLNSKTLFQESISRISKNNFKKINLNNPIIVANKDHEFLIKDQLANLNINEATIILENLPKNTAPSLTLASFEALKNKEDSVLIVMPSDQVIKNKRKFNYVIKKAINIAINESMVIFGISPTEPNVNYGYIKIKNKKGIFDEYDVLDFKEKPNLSIAKKLNKNPLYKWNSGIFVIKASKWLELISHFEPLIFKKSHISYKNSTIKNGCIVFRETHFNSIPSKSIDYAVAEKCPKSKFPIKMIELDAGWSDLGDWSSVWKHSKKDNLNNAIYGDVIDCNTSNNLIYSTSSLIVTLGLKNTLVVQMDDSILIANMDKNYNLKDLLSLLKSKKRKELESTKKNLRPWGSFEILEEDRFFKVKKIEVKPMSQLSLQSHKKRAEHWVVVEGSAEVLSGNKKIVLKQNESTFIPKNTQHRLTNNSSKLLKLIEVQTGSYLGEDDIIRFKDKYGRN
jgi:mannose-1-phosphate guanylyltransferase / mannose-6-phosphate isomerase